jgi:hypothetical protein
MCTLALTKSRNLNCVKKKIGIRSFSIARFDSLNRIISNGSSLGVAQVVSLNITAAATTSSNVTVTLNGTATNVAILTGDATSVVATKIRAAAFTGYTTSGTGTNVIFTATTIGDRLDPIYSAGTTGATGSIAVSTAGQNVGSGGVLTLPSYMQFATAPSGGKIARFDVKNTTTGFNDTLTQNPDTRSGGRKGEFSLTLFSGGGMDNIALSELVDEVTKTDFVGFIEYKTGEIFAVGSQFGCMISSVVDSTGATDGELDGVTITINTEESESFRKYLLTPTAVAEFTASRLAY